MPDLKQIDRRRILWYVKFNNWDVGGELEGVNPPRLKK